MFLTGRPTYRRRAEVFDRRRWLRFFDLLIEFRTALKHRFERVSTVLFTQAALRSIAQDKHEALKKLQEVRTEDTRIANEQ